MKRSFSATYTANVQNWNENTLLQFFIHHTIKGKEILCFDVKNIMHSLTLWIEVYSALSTQFSFIDFLENFTTKFLES